MSNPWPHKIIVGLTGNIATGKSVVMRLATQKGALTLDADKVVHEILDNDPSMQAAIAVAFGPEVRKADGQIDRPALGAIVFSDTEALRDLEAMLHPAVRQEIHRRIDETEAEVVFIEAIKLLEGELAHLCNQIWVTNCSRRTQIERLMVCRGLDDEAAVLRVNAQAPQEEKVAAGNIVIETDGPMAETVSQFEEAWKQLFAPPIIKTQSKSSTSPLILDDTTMIPAGKRTGLSGEKTPDGHRGNTGLLSLLREDEILEENNVPPEVLVRRARPSDIPAILLLMQRSMNGKLSMKRSELLMSFSERSYLIGQVGAEITTVVGWHTDSTTAACIDQIIVYPDEAIHVTGPLLLAEIEQSAQKLICEIILAYLPHEGPDSVYQVFHHAGFEKYEKSDLHRAWQKGIEEMQPAGTFIMAKILRDVRIS